MTDEPELVPREVVREVQREVRAQTEVTIKLGWIILLSVLTNILTLVLAVLVTVRINQATERKFCAIVESQDDRLRALPQDAPNVRDATRSWSALRAALSCDPPKPS